MKSMVTIFVLAVALSGGRTAQAESPVVYAVGAAKVIRSTSDYYDGQYNVTFQMVESDDPDLVHTLIYRLNPKTPTPPIVERLNELSASLSGYELDLTVRCAKPIVNRVRPVYDISKMGCEVLSVGHRRAAK